jgi:uncharacterized membrane protein (UPF0127 family)
VTASLSRRTTIALAAVLALLPGLAAAQTHGDPQPVLEQEKLTIETSGGPVDFLVEMARTPMQQMRGLMFRDEVPPGTGMLFTYDRPRPLSMWMKNTPTSLDMLFIDEAGIIQGIAAETVPFSETVITAPAPVTAVLEILAGEAERLGIEAGDTVLHPHFGTD